MKKQITIGVGEAATTAKEFIDAWKLAERGETVQEKHRLHFENLEILLKTLTPGRWTLLKKLQCIYGCAAPGKYRPDWAYKK
jgi:predicted transcriptional regulator